jgi:hypothetical protein
MTTHRAFALCLLVASYALLAWQTSAEPAPGAFIFAAPDH